MIEFPNGGRLVQDINELPNLENSTCLFLDVETNNVIKGKSFANFYKQDRTCGIAITADEHKGAWYVPIRHEDLFSNLPLDNVLRWAGRCIRTTKRWVNHNCKFDAHAMWADGVEFNSELVCTLTLAKIIDSDRLTKGGYGLDALSLGMLEKDIGQYYHNVRAFLDNLKGEKRYSRVPADILGEYACQDVITNRELYSYLVRRRPEECKRVWDTEIALTPVLFDMEHAGMRVDPTQLKIKELLIMTELMRIQEELQKTTGLPTDPSNSNDCYELLCGRYQLPVLAYTEETIDEDDGTVHGGNPSFDADALTAYLNYPAVAESPELTGIVKKMQRYRDQNTLLNFFVIPYQEHNVDGVMHPDYNQCVRTGRMSCKRPNAQQLSKDAKELIIPDAGCAFGSSDYSQVEFRIIVHYINDLECIAAYARDPDTDFHTWVANMCGIPRRPAKNVNFCVAFAGGKKKVISMLASDMTIVGALGAKVDEMIGSGVLPADQRKIAFDALCMARGEQVYNEYHGRLPNLRECTRRAALNAKNRGYVFNKYGRRRHLQDRATWRAFNAVVQSTAADLMKERTVAVAPRYNKTTRDLGIQIRASVHDETKFHGEKETMRDPRVAAFLVSTMENTEEKFRVAIRGSYGYSSKNWAEACSDAGKMQIDRTLALTT